MGGRKLRIGWDVGAWHCDRNKKSRDALVVLEVGSSGPELLGKKSRVNLRPILMKFRGPELLRKMLDWCGVQEPGSLDVTIAIDTPLGWPQAMLALVADAKLAECWEDDASNPYTRRQTEIDLIKKRIGQPLSAVRDMIGSQSTNGLHFLQATDLELYSCGIWTFRQDGTSITAIETYPAAAIKQIPVPYEETLERLCESAKSTDPDTKDALTCALVAHLFSDVPDGYEPIPARAPEREGWIILPRNS